MADETGLGKSLVARGVIARTIEHLQHDDTIERINVVYVCSNADIAQQNIGRLDVTGSPHLSFASRLTLLAKHSRRLALDSRTFTKPINLVSFTPGTSFDMGWQTGKAEERAMLFLLLERLIELAGYRRRAAVNLLRAQVSQYERFAATISQLRRELDGEIDRGDRGWLRGSSARAWAAHGVWRSHRGDGAKAFGPSGPAGPGAAADGRHAQ